MSYVTRLCGFVYVHKNAVCIIHCTNYIYSFYGLVTNSNICVSKTVYFYFYIYLSFPYNCFRIFIEFII